MITDKKYCNSCETQKGADQFHKRSASPDGLCAKCKDCQREYDKARANKPHRVKARLQYLKTDRGIEASNRAKVNWTKRNPKKRAAHIAVGNAIKYGKIVKPDNCESCGNQPKKLHGHHDDYAKPLDVRWLCSRCHTNWHDENGEALNAS